MNPIGAGERLGHYFDYGSISHTDGFAKPEQPPVPRARSVFQSVGAMVERNLVQIINEIKARAADYKIENAVNEFVSSVKQNPDKEPADLHASRLKTALKAAEKMLNRAKEPVEETISRFLDEMDTEDYETLLESLTAMTPGIDPVKDRFLTQVVATIRAGIASDMDEYALRALDGLAEVCVQESVTIPDVAGQRDVFAFLSIRSTMIERHPDTAFASSRETDRKIQRWFARQTLEVREEVTHAVRLIAETPDRDRAYPAETRLRTFCQRVQNGISTHQRAIAEGA